MSHRGTQSAPALPSRRCDITIYLDADPLTAGLTRLGYGYTSALSFAPPARRLFRGITTTGNQPNLVVGCAETIGPCTFVAIADTDVVSDFTESAGCATSPEMTRSDPIRRRRSACGTLGRQQTAAA